MGPSFSQPVANDARGKCLATLLLTSLYTRSQEERKQGMCETWRLETSQEEPLASPPSALFSSQFYPA